MLCADDWDAIIRSSEVVKNLPKEWSSLQVFTEMHVMVRAEYCEMLLNYEWGKT